MPTDTPCVIVTGAASGIGRTTAQRFAADGWAVVCADRDAAGVQTLADDLNTAGHAALAVTVDVADEAATIAMATAAIDWTLPVRTGSKSCHGQMCTFNCARKACCCTQVVTQEKMHAHTYDGRQSQQKKGVT